MFRNDIAGYTLTSYSPVIVQTAIKMIGNQKMQDACEAKKAFANPK